MALLTSVIIPSRGGADRLPRLLGMLAAQDSAVEVVVVLDGDIDGSSQAVDGWRDRLDLTVIEFGENRGRAAALNAGFEAARGDVLIRCDDDLAPLSDFASRHAAHHSDSPIGVVGLVRNQFPDTAYARAYGRHWDRLQRDHAYASAPDSTWQHWAANCSVSRETWERIGPYDEAYRGYGWEDIDWGYRLHQAGVPVIITLLWRPTTTWPPSPPRHGYAGRTTQARRSAGSRPSSTPGPPVDRTAPGHARSNVLHITSPRRHQPPGLNVSTVESVDSRAR